jgi:hypothetical protein
VVLDQKGLSLSWLYGSWIYNYLRYRCLSPLTRVQRNRWPVASIFVVGPVKQNKDRPTGPVDILGSLGPATFVSSNR